MYQENIFDNIFQQSVSNILQKENISHYDIISSSISHNFQIQFERQIIHQEEAENYLQKKDERSSIKEYQTLELKEDDQKMQLKNDRLKQKNNYPSKNFLMFLWKKIKKYLRLYPQINRLKWWRDLEIKKGSLQLFDQLFRKQQPKSYLQYYFDNKYILREIMLSCIDKQRKKHYVRYSIKVERGFKERRLYCLNEDKKC